MNTKKPQSKRIPPIFSCPSVHSGGCCCGEGRKEGRTEAFSISRLKDPSFDSGSLWFFRVRLKSLLNPVRQAKRRCMNCRRGACRWVEPFVASTPPLIFNLCLVFFQFRAIRIEALIVAVHCTTTFRSVLLDQDNGTSKKRQPAIKTTQQ